MVSSSLLVRWSVVLGALVGGIAWLASAIVDLASAQQGQLLFLMYVIAWVGTLGGLVGLYGRQGRSHVWLGTTGFFAAFIGAALALAGTLLNLLYRNDLLEQGFEGQALGLGLFVTLIGLVLFGVGFALLGVAGVLGRAIPLWCGVAIIVGLPVAWLLEGYGGIVLGLVWLAVGYALWPTRKQAAQQMG